MKAMSKGKILKNPNHKKTLKRFLILLIILTFCLNIYSIAAHFCSLRFGSSCIRFFIPFPIVSKTVSVLPDRPQKIYFSFIGLFLSILFLWGGFYLIKKEAIKRWMFTLVYLLLGFFLVTYIAVVSKFIPNRDVSDSQVWEPGKIEFCTPWK